MIELKGTKDIRALFKEMAEHGVDEFELETAEAKVSVRRGQLKVTVKPAVPHLEEPEAPATYHV
jgi:hypothetical protein